MKLKPVTAIPTRALFDPAIKPRDLRVLAALWIHARQGVSQADRQTIATTARVTEAQASHSVAALCALGYASRSVSGDRRRRFELRLIVPEIGVQSEHLTGAKLGAQSEHLSEHEIGVQSEHLTCAEKVPEVSTQTPIGAQSEHLSAEKVPSLSTYPRAPAYRDKSSLQNSVSTGQKRLFGSEGVQGDCTTGSVADPITTIGHAIAILASAGVPDGFLIHRPDRELLAGWVGQFSEAQILAACERARTARAGRGDQSPFGPRYLDPILRSGGQQDGTRRRGEDLSAEFVRRHGAG